MTLIDNYNTIYKIVKKNGEYYLIQENFDKYKNKNFAHVVVKGINNINIYARNNNLVRVEDIFEKGGKL